MNKLFFVLSTLIIMFSATPCRAVEKAVKLYIPDCTTSIANAIVVGILEDMPGVRHARVNGMDSAATVFFDNATTSVATMRKALGKANIKVENVTIPKDAQGRLITK